MYEIRLRANQMKCDVPGHQRCTNATGMTWLLEELEGSLGYVTGLSADDGDCDNDDDDDGHAELTIGALLWDYLWLLEISTPCLLYSIHFCWTEWLYPSFWTQWLLPPSCWRLVLQSLLLVKVTPFEGSGVCLSWQQNIRNDMYLCLYSQVILPQPLSCLHYNFQFHRLHQLHLPSYLCDYHVISFKWVRKMWYLWVSQGQFCEIMVIFQKLLTYTCVPWWSRMEAADLNKTNNHFNSLRLWVVECECVQNSFMYQYDCFFCECQYIIFFQQHGKRYLTRYASWRENGQVIELQKHLLHVMKHGLAYLSLDQHITVKRNIN